MVCRSTACKLLIVYQVFVFDRHSTVLYPGTLALMYM